jgi:hypothetical protein
VGDVTAYRSRRPVVGGWAGQKIFDHGPVGQGFFDGLGESRLPVLAGGFGVALGGVDASELDSHSHGGEPVSGPVVPLQGRLAHGDRFVE